MVSERAASPLCALCGLFYFILLFHFILFILLFHFISFFSFIVFIVERLGKYVHTVEGNGAVDCALAMMGAAAGRFKLLVVRKSLEKRRKAPAFFFSSVVWSLSSATPSDCLPVDSPRALHSLVLHENAGQVRGVTVATRPISTLAFHLRRRRSA